MRRAARLALTAALACSVCSCREKLPPPITETKPAVSSEVKTKPPEKKDYVVLALESPRIVLIGDSIVHDNKALVSRRILTILSEEKGETLVANKTKRGELVRYWIGKQFDQSVSSKDYNIIVLQGGVNDIMWWVMQSKPAARENIFRRLLNRFGEMIAQAEENKKVLVLVTVSPWKDKGPWNTEAQRYTERLNQWMKKQETRKGVFAADTYSALVSKTDPYAMDERYQGKDVQHPNGEGSRVIADTILRAIHVDKNK